jgi:hypothetical protein
LTKENVENLSFKESQQVLKSKQDDDNEMDIDTLLQAHLTHYTIFYVPSTEEIIVQDRMQVDDEA